LIDAERVGVSLARRAPLVARKPPDANVTEGLRNPEALAAWAELADNRRVARIRDEMETRAETRRGAERLCSDGFPGSSVRLIRVEADILIVTLSLLVPENLLLAPSALDHTLFDSTCCPTPLALRFFVAPSGEVLIVSCLVAKTLRETETRLE
jgi:hypothetical protein